MTFEQYPISRVSQLTTSCADLASPGYYRSKLFIAPFSSNTLVSAAGPILSLLERLCLSETLPPIANIRDNIEHEMRAFYSKLSAANYAEDITGIARYLLAATIDELLGKNYLRVCNETVAFNSFTPLTHDSVEPQQRFFDIVDYIKDRPNQYLDLIELAYFCLIAGFEGKHHMQANGRQSLDNTIEELYQLISSYRVNRPQRLFSENPLPKTTAPNHYKTPLITVLTALGIMMLAFAASHMLLESKAKTLLFGHTQLALLDN